MRYVYLDYNATTPIAPSVQEAMRPFLSDHFGNPSSNHVYGRVAEQAVQDARRQVARLLHAEPDEIVFTAGGTESNNLALKGIFLKAPLPERLGHVMISAIEHPAVKQPAHYLQRLGFSLSICPVNREGVVCPEDLMERMRDDTRLVSIMHANNETGCLQPIAKISRECRARGILLHCDAAQSVGKVETHVDALGVDLLTIAGHKFYGPKGVGALYVRRGVDLEPLLHGAGHEAGLRAGTENVAAIVGLGKAADLAARTDAEQELRMAQLRERLLERLRQEIDGELTVNGEGAERLPNTLSVNFPEVSGQELLRRAPEVCASTGAACHSGHAALSDTLAAMGITPQVARGTVRLSLGWPTSRAEIDRAADLLCEAWHQCARGGPE